MRTRCLTTVSDGMSFVFSLSGLSPFLGDDDNETLNNILACQWNFEEQEFADTSDQAKDFISRFLIVNKRYLLLKKNDTQVCYNFHFIKSLRYLFFLYQLEDECSRSPEASLAV